MKTAGKVIVGGVVLTGAALTAYLLLSGNKPTPPASGAGAANNGIPGIINTSTINQAGSILDQVKNIFSSLQSGQAQPSTATGTYGAGDLSLTVIKARNWQNRAGKQNLGPYIASFNPANNQVVNVDSGWIGQFVPPGTINWRKASTGEVDTWTTV